MKILSPEINPKIPSKRNLLMGERAFESFNSPSNLSFKYGTRRKKKKALSITFNYRDYSKIQKNRLFEIIVFLVEGGKPLILRKISPKISVS